MEETNETIIVMAVWYPVIFGSFYNQKKKKKGEKKGVENLKMAKNSEERVNNLQCVQEIISFRYSILKRT